VGEVEETLGMHHLGMMMEGVTSQCPEHKDEEVIVDSVVVVEGSVAMSVPWTTEGTIRDRLGHPNHRKQE
jgi:hypothetical protein